MINGPQDGHMSVPCPFRQPLIDFAGTAVSTDPSQSGYVNGILLQRP